MLGGNRRRAEEDAQEEKGKNAKNAKNAHEENKFIKSSLMNLLVL